VTEASFPRRLLGHLARGGPGYLQSAMTLGGGTAISSIYAGKMFGYELLWVAPAGMLIGVLMLSVLARLTLTSDERPYAAMARSAGRGAALAWAVGTIVASVIWHFPQYSLAGAAISDAADAAAGLDVPAWLAAFGALAVAASMSKLYGDERRGVRTYETFVKVLVIGAIACFALVVASTSGSTDWGAVARGFVPGLPEARGDVSPWTIVAGGLSSAVGINMVFLYPYSLRARGWGAGDLERARVDLVAGMLIPFTLAASLVVVATANTIPWEPGEAATKMMPVDAARAFGDLLGQTRGRLVFDLGLIGMALSTIALHMIACGFAVSEIAGEDARGRYYRIGTLLPVPGVLGPILWQKMVWIAVPTSVVCGLFLPIAYVGVILWARRDAAGGRRGTLALMAAVTLLFTAAMLKDLIPKLT